MRHTIRSDAEILEKFRISGDCWVVLCCHDPSYAVWNMDRDGFCMRGSFSASLASAIQAYQERVCSLLDQSMAEAPAELSGTLSNA